MTRSIAWLLLAGLSQPIAALAVPPGVPTRVDNAAEPPGGVQTLVLQPEWRLGGAEDDEVFFGVIDQVAADADGQVLLADIQLMQVDVIGPGGELTAVLGRQGEGPGEVTRLGGVLPLPDGTVGLVQLMPGRVVKLDRAGLPAGEIVPRWESDGGRLLLTEIRLAGERIVAAGRRMTRRGESFQMDLWIAELAADGTVGRQYYHEQRQRDLRGGVVSELDGDWAGRGRWAATADGRVIVAPERDRYRLEFHGPEGLERTVTREFTTRRRSEAEQEAVRSRFGRFRRGGRGPRPELQFEVAATEPAILELHALPGGEIWVRTSRSDQDQPPGVMLTYDVLDAEGNFTRQVAVACEGLASRDQLHPLGDGRFVLVKNHAAAVAAMSGVESADTGAELDEAAPLEVVGLRAAAKP